MLLQFSLQLLKGDAERQVGMRRWLRGSPSSFLLKVALRKRLQKESFQFLCPSTLLGPPPERRWNPPGQCFIPPGPLLAVDNVITPPSRNELLSFLFSFLLLTTGWTLLKWSGEVNEKESQKPQGPS